MTDLPIAKKTAKFSLRLTEATRAELNQASGGRGQTPTTYALRAIQRALVADRQTQALSLTPSPQTATALAALAASMPPGTDVLGYLLANQATPIEPS
jgi:uncharacterized protein (DUF1778 family)